MGWVRLAVNFGRFWAGYLRRVAPARRRGTLVVGDRWAYGYLAQSYALKYYGPDWLARTAIRALPQPDLVVNLAAPAEVIHERKQELSIADIRLEMGHWEMLPSKNLLTVDATLSPSTLANMLARQPL